MGNYHFQSICYAEQSKPVVSKTLFSKTVDSEHVLENYDWLERYQRTLFKCRTCKRFTKKLSVLDICHDCYDVIGFYQPVN